MDEVFWDDSGRVHTLSFVDVEDIMDDDMEIETFWGRSEN